MKNFTLHYFAGVSLIALSLAFGLVTNARAQSKFEVLTESALTRVVPKSFYFAGQSAETQMRNAAAAKVGAESFVIAGLVDTSGYSTEISGKYEGFLITDSPIKFGDKMLGTGAYGFGFAPNGRVNIYDLGARLLASATTTKDDGMTRPRPLMMSANAKGVRLYKGKIFVTITTK